ASGGGWYEPDCAIAVWIFLYFTNPMVAMNAATTRSMMTIRFAIRTSLHPLPAGAPSGAVRPNTRPGKVVTADIVQPEAAGEAAETPPPGISTVMDALSFRPDP